MELHAILKTLLFTFLLLILIFLCKITIRQLLGKTSYTLWLAITIFGLISGLIILTPESLLLTKDPQALSNLLIIKYIAWWFSLNYLINQIIINFIWDRAYAQHGIAVSKILKDLTTILLMILTLAAIINFVFNKSVLGIFTASGVIAIILGYSAQATLSDIFSGLGLNTGKEFKEGDWIRINDLSNSTGKVIDLNWRVVKLKTKENNFLSYPNSVISKLSIVNLSCPEPKRGIILPFKTASHHSPTHIKNILVSAAKQSTKVHPLPPPKAELILFEKDLCHYQLIYYTTEIHESIVNDEILSIIWYILHREPSKTLPAPTDEMTTPENVELQTLPSKEQIITFLRSTDLFHKLTQTELDLLAAKAIYHSYGPPERVLEQGQANTSLFLLYSGSVNIYFIQQEASPVFITNLTQGDYFGEMSLLTGETCTATVIIKEESIIIEIDHANIASLFAERPALMEQMSALVLQRKESNTSLQRTLKTTKKLKDNSLMDWMMNKVKLFFKH